MIFKYKYLYNKIMPGITSLFSSKARLDVLRVLVCQTTPLPLRHVATLSGSSLFSVQRALRQLVDEKILIRRKKGPYVLFSLNEQNAFHSFLIRFFDLETKSRVALLADRYREKAQRSLDFSHSAQELFKGVRSWTSKAFSKKS